jgi:hypothetical protein
MMTAASEETMMAAASEEAMMTAASEETMMTAASEETMMTAASEEARMTAAAMALAVGKQKTSSQQLCVGFMRRIREISACKLQLFFLFYFDMIGLDCCHYLIQHLRYQ